MGWLESAKIHTHSFPACERLPGELAVVYSDLQESFLFLMAAAAEFLERWNSAAGERNEAEEDALIFAEQRIPEQLASPRSTSAHTLKEWLTRADDVMNKHLNEYTALLKKKKAFCVEQLKTLDKFLLLCRRMQIRCEGLLQADAFRQLSTGEADDAVMLPEEEEFSLGLLQISATLLKDRITGTEASLRAVQVGANHFCEKIDTAYGHDWAAWTDAVWNAAHRAEVIMVTSIFSRGVSATMREKESLYHDTIAAADKIKSSFDTANYCIYSLQREIQTALTAVQQAGRIQETGGREEEAICL